MRINIRTKKKIISHHTFSKFPYFPKTSYYSYLRYEQQQNAHKMQKEYILALVVLAKLQRDAIMTSHWMAVNSN